jgi:exosortase K
MPRPPATRIQIILLACLLLGAAFALKWWYRTAALDDLGFVLKPVTALLGLLTGEPYSRIQDTGYLFPGLGILIDRSCSGVNFFVITTATFAFIVLKNINGGCARPLLALLSMAGAYALTILTNTGRILLMVRLEHVQLHLAPRAHEAVGAFFFLAALLLASLLLDHLLHHTTTTSRTAE